MPPRCQDPLPTPPSRRLRRLDSCRLRRLGPIWPPPTLQSGLRTVIADVDGDPLMAFDLASSSSSSADAGSLADSNSFCASSRASFIDMAFFSRILVLRTDALYKHTLAAYTLKTPLWSAMHLVKTYCLLILLYGCEAGSMSDVKRNTTMWNKCFRHIFSRCWRESTSDILHPITPPVLGSYPQFFLNIYHYNVMQCNVTVRGEETGENWKGRGPPRVG